MAVCCGLLCVRCGRPGWTAWVDGLADHLAPLDVARAALLRGATLGHHHRACTERYPQCTYGPCLSLGKGSQGYTTWTLPTRPIM